MEDRPCVWDSYTGATFDLHQLMRVVDQESYTIVDGDIPCTPAAEPSYAYAFNICGDVTSPSVPEICTDNGAALQWAWGKCYVIGTYDSNYDETIWSLLDPTDPSKGVSLSYIGSPQYKCAGGSLSRSLTIDLNCANKQTPTIDFAQEPELCQYHISLKSQYACPLECPVTSNGLCSSHGHCGFDKTKGFPRCYCNSGYSGKGCNDHSSGGDGSQSSNGAQIVLVVILLVITLGLVALVVFMVKQVKEFRQEQFPDGYTQLEESEMVVR